MQGHSWREPNINGVCSRDNLLKEINDEAYVINLDGYADVLWITLYMLDNDAIYFDSFDVEHICKEINCFIGDKNRQKTYSEYKHMIQLCMDILALYLLTICLQARLSLTILVFFCRMILKEATK